MRRGVAVLINTGDIPVQSEEEEEEEEGGGGGGRGVEMLGIVPSSSEVELLGLGREGIAGELSWLVGAGGKLVDGAASLVVRAITSASVGVCRSIVGEVDSVVSNPVPIIVVVRAGGGGGAGGVAALLGSGSGELCPRPFPFPLFPFPFPLFPFPFPLLPFPFPLFPFPFPLLPLPFPLPLLFSPLPSSPATTSPP